MRLATVSASSSGATTFPFFGASPRYRSQRRLSCARSGTSCPVVKDLLAENRMQQDMLARAMAAMQLLLYSKIRPSEQEIQFVQATLRELEKHLNYSEN